MHVVLVGLQTEVVATLHADGHETTVLYEVAHRERLAGLDEAVTRSCVVDSYGSVESLWSALRHLDPPRPVDVVVTATELAVVPAAVLATLVGARGMDPATALACRDKAVQKQCWASAGVPTARWVVAPEGVATKADASRLVEHADLGWPVVVKPLAGGASEAVAVARDPAQLVAAAAEVQGGGRVLVEQFVPGREWHLDGAVRGGELLAFMVSTYGDPVLTSKEGTPVRSVARPPAQYPDLYAAAGAFTRAALEALGMKDGVFHFEAFGEPGSFVAGELGARPGGGLVGAVALRTVGVDLWAASARTMTDDPVPVAPVEPAATHGWVILPSAAGSTSRVRRADLDAVPGVTEVRMRVPYGAPTPASVDSASAGIAYAAVTGRTERECHAVMAAALAVVDDLQHTSPTTSDG